MSGVGDSESPHELLNPDELAPPRGFTHAVAAAAGRTVYLAGQTGHGSDGALRGTTVVEQFDAAAENVVMALTAAGASPRHLVSMQIFVTDAAAYREAVSEIGEAWRRRFGRHYPAAALFEVSGLFDPEALIELVGVAVVPE